MTDKTNQYVITLRDTRTGETKEILDGYPWNDPDDEHGFIWYWTEGNFGCDCNRSIVFFDYEEEKELECNARENVIELVSIYNKISGKFLELP